ncbi:Regulatory protein SoxS [compost metagenome]
MESVENIPLSYQAARMAYRYCFFAGTEAIIHYASVEAFSPGPLVFSFEQYRHILKAGDINGTNRFIDSFAEALRENMQLETAELALLQISSAIYQVVLELELQLLLPPSNLFDGLKKDTLEATLDNIRSLSVQIAAHVKESGNQAHAEVVQKLKAYIDEHLEDNLSLNILSEVASLAPAYVSTLFGEVMKESFTDYVTRVRLDKAAIMLRENKDLSVTEIAGRVGYKNVQYFHNKFKQKYGVTPVQYRHAMKS